MIKSRIVLIDFLAWAILVFASVFAGFGFLYSQTHSNSNGTTYYCYKERPPTQDLDCYKDRK